MSEIKINIKFKNFKKHKDSEKREYSILGRIILRGIKKDNIK